MMESELLPNMPLISSAVILGCIGLGLIFVGVLVSLLSAIGNKHRYWAWAIILVFPLSFMYSLKYRQLDSYAFKLLYSGLLCCVLFIGAMYFELTRLGLDFQEVMGSTKLMHSLPSRSGEPSP